MARIRKRRRRRFFPLVFPALLLAVLAAAGITAASSLLKKTEENYYNSAYPLKYSELVTEYCKNESGFQPDAVSNVDARGLMQIQGPTLEWAVYREKEDAQVTADDLFDPEVNVKYGVYLLSLFLEEFKTPDVALCAYRLGFVHPLSGEETGFRIKPENPAFSSFTL